MAFTRAISLLRREMICTARADTDEFVSAAVGPQVHLVSVGWSEPERACHRVRGNLPGNRSVTPTWCHAWLSECLQMRLHRGAARPISGFDTSLLCLYAQSDT